MTTFLFTLSQTFFNRFYQPTEDQLCRLVKNNFVTDADVPDDPHILEAITIHPQTYFITISKAASERVNSVVIHKLFSKEKPMLIISGSNNKELQLYRGMKVMITENRDKARYFVNGTIGTVKNVEKRTVFVRLVNGNMLSVYPIYNHDATFYYPLIAGYATTIYKAQGKTLDHVTIWFDNNIISPGTGYTAISRVRELKDICFLTRPKTQHFIPVQL